MGYDLYQHLTRTVKNIEARRRSTQFNRRSYKEDITYNIVKFEKKATPHQLRKIREKIQKENRRNRRITIFLLVFIILLIVVLFYWLIA